MTFADFPGVGDRSVLILDGRNRLPTWRYHAEQHGRKHGYKLFRIMRGESFTRATPLTQWIYIRPLEPNK